jgi:hypothetical protein
MPEAAMHEYSGPVLGQQNIRASRQAASVQAEPEASPMQKPTHGHFGSCVRSADARHHSRAGRLIHYVGHCLFFLAVQALVLSVADGKLQRTI